MVWCTTTWNKYINRQKRKPTQNILNYSGKKISPIALFLGSKVYGLWCIIQRAWQSYPLLFENYSSSFGVGPAHYLQLSLSDFTCSWYLQIPGVSTMAVAHSQVSCIAISGNSYRNSDPVTHYLTSEAFLSNLGGCLCHPITFLLCMPENPVSRRWHKWPTQHTKRPETFGPCLQWSLNVWVTGHGYKLS